MAIGAAGAKNAGIFAAQIIGVKDEAIAQKLKDYKEKMKQDVYKANEEVQAMLRGE
jgi:5-(carboxyamino)imidazole ribonucleotide mutase